MEEELEKDNGRDMTPRLIGETYLKKRLQQQALKDADMVCTNALIVVNIGSVKLLKSTII